MIYIKINVTDKIPDYENKPIREGAEELIWRSVFFNALNTVLPTELMSLEDKKLCYYLTKKVYDTATPDLSLNERNFLLEKIRKIYNPLICGRAEELLDKEEPKLDN